MEHATCGIAVSFVEQAGIKQGIVDDQEEQAPTHKGKIKATQVLEKKALFVVERCRFKEIAGTQKKDGHVKLKDETA